MRHLWILFPFLVFSPVLLSGRDSVPSVIPDSIADSIGAVDIDTVSDLYTAADSLFLFGDEDMTALPELVVASRRKKALHLLAYVREFSTLSTYSDSVFLFREKLVDFMLPPGEKSRFRGWSTPRVIKTRSYYRFTNASGLDSVSDESSHHFSWSDWIGVEPREGFPAALRLAKVSVDTLSGKYSPAEIWRRNDDRVSIDINVLALPSSRKWVPNLSTFFDKGVDFENIKLRYDYDNVLGDTVSPLNLTGYSFIVESNERGHKMFKFSSPKDPVFVSTEADVRVLDREFISLKEAREWEKHNFDNDEIDIYTPADAPSLRPEIAALVARVENVDKEGVRLDREPDTRLVSKFDSRRNYGLGRRLLFMLKDITGISYFKSHRNFKNGWKDFKTEQTKKNKSRKREEE